MGETLQYFGGLTNLFASKKYINSKYSFDLALQVALMNHLSILQLALK
jgi:hypothetical protein